MKRLASHIVSIILIPLLAPTYLFAIILFYFPHLTSIVSIGDKLLSILYIFIATTLLPFIVVFILYKRKVIRTLTLDNKEDRVIPQAFSCVIYTATCLLLVYKVGATNALTLSMVAVAISVIGLTLITPYWKISTHACGSWGLFAILYDLNSRFPVQSFQPLYYTILFLTVSVCFARLYLKVHTPMQVLAGSVMGVLIGFSLFHFFLN
ncbi:phosphatase PAP2 family protein [Mucilaginibacter paludis]|uniref:Phosphoesterase PA-phosphatase related protein n=1 Tax=Mucilaginibacter paludis DSM 18603 TaxID=714943 RepID=H1Y0Y7_9SPHI|nr:phosphatase PAP2 family protein [Mucilaginibacter paludis]EHQ29212.1 phosphoesterase PA-phosphatase related protein [Mucilaginibacter paludis DSM 18603]